MTEFHLSTTTTAEACIRVTRTQHRHAFLWLQAKAQAKAEFDKFVEENAKELAALRQRVPEEAARAANAAQLKEELESVRADLASRASTIDRLGRSHSFLGNTSFFVTSK